MFLAYKYARKKYKERQEAKAQEAPAPANGPSDTEPQRPAETEPPVDAPGAVGNDQIQAPGPVVGDKTTVVTEKAATPSQTKAKKAEKHEPTPEERAETKRRRRYRAKILFGLVLPFTLQAIDMTIVASALPFIAKSFNEIQELNWIISAFNLTSAAFLPFWAQITDIFGRHVTLQATILIVAIGSAICTGAPTNAFGVLLLGRALQGIGASGIGISVRTIMADRVSLKEYALNWTLFSLLNAGAFSVGPVAGGYLTQISWRWCFAINLPVAAVAIIVVIILLRKDLLGPQPLPELEGRDVSTRHARFWLRLSTIDFGGQLLFLGGLGLLILAFTWAGGSYPWDSAHVLAPLVIGAVLSVAWMMYEYSMSPPHLMSRVFPIQRAMMPWELLSQPDIGLLFYINFASGMAMFAVMYFMDLYFALVQGNSASKSGIALLFFLPGLGIGAYMSMFCTNVWPRQTLPALLLGSTTSAVGISVLAWATSTENTNLIYGMMALTGHGVGMRMNPGSLHGLAYFPAMTAAISCLVSFALPFGGTVALTLMSTVFNNKSGVNHENVKGGIEWAFITMVPFMWLCVLLATFLGNVWIGKDGSHEVVNGAYLWSFVTRKKLVREKRTRGDLGQPAAPNPDNGITNGNGAESKEADSAKGPDAV